MKTMLFLFQYLLFSLFIVLVLAKTRRTMLNNSGDSKKLCHALDFNGHVPLFYC